MNDASQYRVELPPPRGRPLVITLVCLWWFIAAPIGGLLAIIEINRVLSAPFASDALRASYAALGVYTGFVGVGVVSMIGVWHMRKWGVTAMGILLVISQSVALLGSGWSLGGFLSWLIPVIVGAVHYPKMK